VRRNRNQTGDPFYDVDEHGFREPGPGHDTLDDYDPPGWDPFRRPPPLPPDPPPGLDEPGRMSQRTNNVLLDGVVGVGPAPLVDLTNNAIEALAARWRIIELTSDQTLPWLCLMEWTAGDGAGMKVVVNVPHGSTRVCLFARTLRFKAQNLSNLQNRVRFTVADGHDGTRNEFEIDGPTQAETSIGSLFPPYTDKVRLELADPAAYGTSFIRFYDGLAAPTLVSTVMANAQPSYGTPVGQGADIRVKADSAWRLIFYLRA